MERANRILSHPDFQRELAALEELERNRPFCRHGLPHLLDVARLMRIYALEEELNLPVDILYAAALLHDLGRGEEYRTGTPHELAGTKLANAILKDCGFLPWEQTMIAHAISHHRGLEQDNALSRLLYRADKRSRPCYSCKAAWECNWPMEKRNLTLEV